MVAGPNGAGKTTFAAELLSREVKGLGFVNADMIAAELNPSRPSSAAVQAGRLALGTIDRHVAQGTGFCLETTLSGRGYARSIRLWQDQGYRVSLYFLRLPDPDLAVARVRLRVSEGGHDVPEGDVRRRFHAGLRNFERVYRDVADDWKLFDNSGGVPILIAEEGKAVTQEDSADSGAAGAIDGPETAAALAALHRAARRARRRALELGGGMVAVYRDGEIVWVSADDGLLDGDTEPDRSWIDLVIQDSQAFQRRPETASGTETERVMAALRRAAKRARRRALELGDGMISIYRDGGVVWVRADDGSLDPLDDDNDLPAPRAGAGS